MAHLRSIQQDCQQDDCMKRAVVQLLSRSNTPYGLYCTPHGDTAAQRLEEQEAQPATPPPLIQFHVRLKDGCL